MTDEHLGQVLNTAMNPDSPVAWDGLADDERQINIVGAKAVAAHVRLSQEACIKRLVAVVKAMQSFDMGAVNRAMEAITREDLE